jgi:hypothetical protein
MALPDMNNFILLKSFGVRESSCKKGGFWIPKMSVGGEASNFTSGLFYGVPVRFKRQVA